MGATLTPEKINENFYYQPETGVCRWKVSPGSKIKVGDVTGSLGNLGYLKTMFCGKNYQTHRLIFAGFHGHWPKGEIDHINGLKTDNRIENLREVTHGENQKNARLSKANKSGCSGVRWRKDCNKWQARIRVDNREIHLGHFIYLPDAVKARKAAQAKYDFHKNHGAD